MGYQVTEESFMKDVADHSMIVLRDDGVYRHVVFKKPGTSDMRFDLITWPGCLCYTGDMGSYVFRRTEDMFSFFRGRKGDKSLAINPGYWSEKLEALDRTDGVKEFSLDRFREEVRDAMEDREVSDELRSDVEDLMTEYFSNEYEAREAVREIEDGYPDIHIFANFWEVSVTRYVGRFVWCCYAIAWGIRTYDLSKVTAGEQVNA